MARILELIWGKWQQKYFENPKKDSTALSTSARRANHNTVQDGLNLRSTHPTRWTYPAEMVRIGYGRSIFPLNRRELRPIRRCRARSCDTADGCRSGRPSLNCGPMPVSPRYAREAGRRDLVARAPTSDLGLKRGGTLEITLLNDLQCPRSSTGGD